MDEKTKLNDILKTTDETTTNIILNKENISGQEKNHILNNIYLANNLLEMLYKNKIINLEKYNAVKIRLKEQKQIINRACYYNLLKISLRDTKKLYNIFFKL